MKIKSLVAISVVTALGLSACKPAPEQSSAAEPKVEQESPMTSGIDLSAIDKNVRPQDDFFRHVNGAWLNKTDIPGDKSSYSVFNIIYDDTQENLKALIQEAAEANTEKGSNNQKLGDMYNSYMNEELANKLGLSPLESQLKGIASIATASDLAHQLSEMFRIGVDIPFGMFVYPDAKDPTKYGAWTYQSGLTMPDRDYYLKEEEKFVNFRAATETFMANVLKAAGQENAEEAAQKVMALELKIANAHQDKVDARDAEKNYNKRTSAEVAALFDGLDWATFAKGAGLSAEQDIIVRNYPYFEGMGAIFASTELDTWKDYLTYKLVVEFAPRLHQELVDLNFAYFSTTLNGIPEQRPRWKRAVASTSNVLGEVLGQQYVERHFTPKAKAKMDALVKNLTKAYGQSIQELDWMSEDTKKQALDKLSKFYPKIGYPDKWRDYSNLQIEGDDLVGNYMRFNAFQYDYHVGRIGQPVDKNDWGMTPQTINAYYSPTENQIVFPAGILQAPFFDMNAEDAVNYGAIGAVIGHEIGHGFDDQGSKYDGDGNLRVWWTEDDLAAFKQRSSKLIEQYNQYEPLEGQTVNGELTLGENIGDLAGATIGYKAYKMSLNGKPSKVIDGLTGEQRFFMGYAQAWRGKYRDDALRARLLSDPHSPGEFRTNGIVVNVDAFYEAFDVKPGDAMYLPPEERVKIW